MAVEIIDQTTNDVRITLNGRNGDIIAGGNGSNGALRLKNNKDKVIAALGLWESILDESIPAYGMLFINDAKGATSLCYNAKDGVLELTGGSGEIKVKDWFHLDNGGLRIGGGKDGVLTIKNKHDKETFRADSNTPELALSDFFRVIDGEMRIGDGSKDGIFRVKNRKGKVTFLVDSSSGEIKVGEKLRIDGKVGDIMLSNADCAEDFDLANGEEAAPGAVMVLSEDGAVRQSDTAYDTAVAGVISGAGKYRPGIIMDRRASARQRVPLAIMGKVFCLVDADFGAVQPGMLLTSSPRRGHAMRAGDPQRAFGAVIGKALVPLAAGQELIPVLVALQ